MPSAEPPPLSFTPEYCVLARQNDSLGHRPRWTAFAIAAFASLAIAAWFVLAGAWPVLPFTALELVLLAGAFALVERRARDWERLTVAGDRVVLESMRGGRRTCREFNRYWLSVELEAAGPGSTPELALRFRGERMAFGGALPPGRRLEVARSLARLTGGR
jgi:uncharacterized membrane protein